MDSPFGMVTTRGRGLDVLVVSHEASRTGAPRVAVEVLRALTAAGLSVQCLLRWPGPLQDDLLRAADGCRLEPLRRTRVLLRRFRRTRALAVGLEERVARQVLLRTRPRSVYANTVLSACYVRPALRLGLPVVLHVHELEPLTSSVLNRYGISGPLPGLTLVACSTAVRDNGVDHLGLAGCGVEVLPSVTDATRVRQFAGVPTRLGVQVVVGACGTRDPRKGTDVFAELASRVSGLGDVVFRWIGGGTALDTYPGGDAVAFLPDQASPCPALAALDVFVLASRVDAFPLVVLQAMILGVPVVAFDVGGVAEQVGGAGILVPAGDRDGLEAAVRALVDDSALRRRLGLAGQARVTELYGIEDFDRQVVGLVDRTRRRNR